MYIAAYKIFLDNKILGVGPRQFRNTCGFFPLGKKNKNAAAKNPYDQLLNLVLTSRKK